MLEENNMSRISESQSISAKNRKAEVITTIMGIVTLLAPAQLVFFEPPRR